LIRREIKLGVTYGSSSQEVIRILTEAAARHGLVLDQPEPIATLSNFGEKSMEFTLFFWIDQNDKTSAIVVESDLRIIIEKRLTEEGIYIPIT
jgi:small-conductance mechanosensitive channel